MRVTCAVLLMGLAASVLAHKPSDSFLRISTTDGIAIQWDIALRDLEHAIGLDSDGDGAVTRGELNASLPRISAHALAHLRVAGSDGHCQPSLRHWGVSEHSDGPYVVLHVTAVCSSRNDLFLDYELFFDFDPTHRALVSYDDGNQRHARTLHDKQRRFEFPLSGHDPSP